MSDVKLYRNHREREMYDNMADLFSIIKTTEALEKAFVRDSISNEEYTSQCKKLITQFNAARNLTRECVPNLDQFMSDHKLNCRTALDRLKEGVPMGGGKVDDSARTIAETVQFFITSMDSLKLGMVATDQLSPIMHDLHESVGKVSNLPPDWDGKKKIKKWISTMNKMKASEELDDDQVRQMLFDLESAYNLFHKSLS